MFKKLLLVLGLFVLTANFMNAQTITGKVLDAETSIPVEAATIKSATETAVVSENDGSFSIRINSKTGSLKITHIGYEPKIVKYDIRDNQSILNLGVILLKQDEATSLDEIIIVGKGVIDLARDRKTPIAVSTIKGTDIQDKIGTGDISQALVNTPSVYVGNQSGGFGDSRISVRGFEQDNTAYLLNGQPINGMEDGKVYWSNWSGMSDIANAIQIQRGLGSSKLAISSVGGTVNFVTKATELREGGFVSFGTANDSYYKGTIAYNTGMNKDGWGASILLSHWQGDGYNAGTKGAGQNYFFSIGYKPNDVHQFNLLLTGAPQYHDQNFSKRISDYQKYGRKYNSNWGYLDGKYVTERKNFYHKPVANFNWDYKINKTTNLSTVLYASWGRGGGTGNYGSSSYRLRDNASGLYVFDSVVKHNLSAANGIGSSSGKNYLIRASMNNHSWNGVVSNLSKELSKYLTLNVGLDIRTYKGTHYRQVADFMGLNGWTESRGLRGADHQPSSTQTANTVTESLEAMPWSALFKTIPANQRIDYDYSENISYGGLFGQIEYAKESFSTFFQGSLSTQSHKRKDVYDYQPQYQDAEKVNNLGYNVKGGLSVNPGSGSSSFYANAGFYSRQPYHDNVYLNFTNQINPLTSNEKILGLELGYAFNTPGFTASLNAYRTTWADRVTTTSNLATIAKTYGTITVQPGDVIYTSNQGVEQVHTGLELDFSIKTIQNLKINGFGSIGNWVYNGDVIQTLYNESLQTLEVKNTDVDGGKVGGSAQTTFGLGAVYEFFKGFSTDVDWRYFAKNYATVVAKDNLVLPSYNVTDAGIAYKLFLKNRKSIRIRFNVNNLFQSIYLSDATTNIKATDNVSSSNPGAGTYQSNNRMYKGLADANQVYFGMGRTWAVTVKYSF